MKRKVINVSESAHSSFFSIREEIRKRMKLKVNSDYVMQQLIRAYHQSSNSIAVLDDVTKGMYQLEAKE